jgi:hypothetical protein
VIDQFLPRVGINFRPRFLGAVLFYIAALRANDEIIEAHA